METSLPSTELIQMGLGINSSFVQLLTRRKKLLRQAQLEPVVSEAHSSASFHRDKAEYLPWSTLWMLICVGLFDQSLSLLFGTAKLIFIHETEPFLWELLKPLFDNRRNMLHY